MKKLEAKGEQRNYKHKVKKIKGKKNNNMHLKPTSLGVIPSVTALRGISFSTPKMSSSSPSLPKADPRLPVLPVLAAGTAWSSVEEFEENSSKSLISLTVLLCTSFSCTECMPLPNHEVTNGAEESSNGPFHGCGNNFDLRQTIAFV